MGEDAVGIAVSMKPGGDILQLGKALDTETERLQRSLPVGMELHRVADQPAAVRDSVGEFVRVLAEAVIIVLAVSFVVLFLLLRSLVALVLLLLVNLASAAAAPG